MKFYKLITAGMCVLILIGCSTALTGQAAVTSTEETVLAGEEKNSSGAWVSARDFGAVGDGVTDDTAAVQRAVSSEQPVYFPRGTYLISSPVVITNKIYWSMYAQDATFLYTGKEYALRILSAENCRIEVGQIRAMEGGGIEFASDSDHRWNQYVVLTFNCIECCTDCIHVEVTGQGWCAENQVYGGRFKAGQNGVHVQHTGRNYTNGWKFYNCGIEGVENGFLFDAGRGYIDDMVIVNPRYEESYRTILQTEGSVFNCLWIGTSLIKADEIRCSDRTTRFEILAPVGDSGHRGCIIDGKVMVEKTEYEEAE